MSTQPSEGNLDFSLRFGQWRPGEGMVASFYVASEKPLEQPPLPSVKRRPIIDGEVIFRRPSPLEQVEATESYINRLLPPTLSLVGKITGIVLSSAGILVIVSGPLMVWPFNKWRVSSAHSRFEKQVRQWMIQNQEQVEEMKRSGPSRLAFQTLQDFLENPPFRSPFSYFDYHLLGDLPEPMRSNIAEIARNKPEFNSDSIWHAFARESFLFVSSFYAFSLMTVLTLGVLILSALPL